MSTLLVVLVLLLLIGAFPAWPYSRGWGYSPFSAIIGILLVLLILRLLGVL